MTTFRHHFLSEAQIKLLTDMVNERFEEGDNEGREPFRAVYPSINSNQDFSRVIAQLRAIPTLARRRAQARVVTPSVAEPGYYRNPDNGGLYRIVERTEKGTWGRPDRTALRVAVYSKTGGPRRLDVRGNLVKGKWTYKGKAESNQLRRSVIKAEWKIDEEGLLEFAYGFCPLHGGPLSDGVSVALGYGPKCAANNSLPWSEDAARTVLIAQGIDPDAFFAEHNAKAEG